MIDSIHSQLFLTDSVDKQLHIVANGVEIDNTMLHMNDFTLEESISSNDELLFGSCEASSIKFRVSSVVDSLKDKILTVSMTLEGEAEPFKIGKYQVESDTPTADRSWRDIVAYDQMKDILNADVIGWYNSLSFPMTLKQFRDSFFANLGVQVIEMALVNDSAQITKTIDAAELSGKQVVNAICELNGVFGHINRDGKFVFISLEENIDTLLPSNDLYPAEDLYPSMSNAYQLTGSYINCRYEDYVANQITGVRIRQSGNEEDFGTVVGTQTNLYTIQDNFLTFGMSNSECQYVGERFLEKVKHITYRPFECNAIGNPCLEVGDNIRLNTTQKIIKSFVWSRTINGIQSLNDSISARGKEKYEGKVNSINTQITQLRGKVNILKRDVDETRSELYDYEQATNSLILQTSSEIRTEINNTKDDLHSEITQTSEKINLRVKKAEDEIGEIDLRADAIDLRVTNTKAELEGKINLTATQFNTTISNTAAGLQSQINQTSNSLALKVDLQDVSHQLSIENEGINLVSDRTVNIESNNFTVTSENLKVQDSGRVLAKQFVAADWMAIVGTEYDNNRVFIDAYDGTTIRFSKRHKGDGNAIVICGTIACADIQSSNYIHAEKKIETVGNVYGNNLVAEGTVICRDPNTTGNSANIHITEAGYLRQVTSGSSKRWKHDISTELPEDMNPQKLYNVNVVQFKYNTDYLDNQLDQRYNKPLIGFIAEDMAEKYPQAADFDEYGLPSGWNEHYLIPAMMKLIQEQHEEIEKLKKRVEVLENVSKSERNETV